MASERSDVKQPSEEPTPDPQKKIVTEFGFPEKTIPTFYINNAQFSISDLELRIDMGEIQYREIVDGTRYL